MRSRVEVVPPEDSAFMSRAIEAARAALERDDLPVGSLLAVGGEAVEDGANRLRERKDWSSHAEVELLQRHSSELKRRHKERRQAIVLYTTLEPCLMCLGTALLHRVSRVVYACPDPQGGAAGLEPSTLPLWYSKRWPEISGGILRDEACELLLTYMARREGRSWQKRRRQLEKLRASW